MQISNTCLFIVFLLAIIPFMVIGVLAQVIYTGILVGWNATKLWLVELE